MRLYNITGLSDYIMDKGSLAITAQLMIQERANGNDEGGDGDGAENGSDLGTRRRARRRTQAQQNTRGYTKQPFSVRETTREYSVESKENYALFDTDLWLCFEWDTSQVEIGERVIDPQDRLVLKFYIDDDVDVGVSAEIFEVPVYYAFKHELIMKANGDTVGYLTFDVFWKTCADRIRVSNRNWLTRRGCMDWWHLCLLQTGTCVCVCVCGCMCCAPFCLLCVRIYHQVHITMTVMKAV